MDKSQVRRLARDFAQGKIETGDYRRQRRQLVEGIVSGAVAIEREAQPRSAPLPVSDIPTPAAAAPPNLKPLYAAVAVLVIALVVWIAWPSSSPAPAAPQPSAEDAVPVRQVSAARTLVEEFIAARDWSGSSVSDFTVAWNALDPTDRIEAQGQTWFRRLSKAIGQEIKAQNALAEIDESGAAVQTAMRLVDLGRALGIEDRLPAAATLDEIGEDKTSSVPEVPATPVPPPSENVETVTEALPAPAPVPDVSPPAVVPPANVATSEPPAPAAPSSTDWLARQTPERFTIQLFAVNHLDRVEQLVSAQPDLALQIVTAEARNPKYRVLVGSYDTLAAARAAYSGLSVAVRDAQPNPLFKRIQEVQDAVGVSARTAPMRESRSPAELGADGYTLQLFASNSRENVDRLVARYPALGLEVHETSDAASPYRVLYGRYPTPAEAEKASGSLPPAVLTSIGQPLVKSLSELLDSTR